MKGFTGIAVFSTLLARGLAIRMSDNKWSLMEEAEEGRLDTNVSIGEQQSAGHLLLPPELPGDERNSWLPEALSRISALNLARDIEPASCEPFRTRPFDLGERVQWRFSSYVKNATVVSLRPLEVTVEEFGDTKYPAREDEITRLRGDAVSDRILLSGDVHFRLFLSVVAGKFADDGEDDSFYQGDFFTRPALSDQLRCYYAQLLRDAAQIVAKRHPGIARLAGWGHEDGKLLRELADEVEGSLITKPLGLDTMRTVLRQVADLGRRLRNLLPGKALLFPCGWHGHAVYCEVQRSKDWTFALAIFNSGDGISYHYSITHDGLSRKYSPALVYTSIPERELLHPTQLRLLIEAGATSLSRGGGSVSSGPASMYAIGLGRLERWLNEERSTAVMMDSQAGGTCMVTGIHHFVHFKLRELAKPQYQEEVGRIIEHSLQRAALGWFADAAQDLEFHNVLPPLERFQHSDDNGVPIPLPAASFYQWKRRKQLLHTAARQVMMLDEEDAEAQGVARKLLAWIGNAHTPLPGDLHDTGGDSAVTESLPPVAFEEIATSSGSDSTPALRLCALPEVLMPSSNASPYAVLSGLANINLDTIDLCFGETYVDWLSAKILALDVSTLQAGERSIIPQVFHQLTDQIRRLSSTQPFADHLLALRALALRYHELAADHDKSLQDFDPAMSLMTEGLETPQNLLFSQELRDKPDRQSNRTKAKYLYVLAAPETNSLTSLKQIEMLCKADLHMDDSELRSSRLEAYGRDSNGDVAQDVRDSWKARAGREFETAESYVVNFVRQEQKRWGQVSLWQVDHKDPCGVWPRGLEVVDGRADQVRRAAACILAGRSRLLPVNVGDDFFAMRKMLVEYHLLDQAIAPRDKEFEHASSQPEEKDKQDQWVGYMHWIEVRYCGFDVKYSADITRRVASRARARLGLPRHPARYELRRRLSDEDERAITQFLFRDVRATKWQQDESGAFLPRHDGDNGIVLYDVATYGSDKQLSIMQRTLFEVGVHSSLTRAQWLGHLQEHPFCLLDEVCRVATTAIFFSEKYNPKTCTGSSETPRAWFEQAMAVVSSHLGALKTEEPTADLIIAMSFARVTLQRLRAHIKDKADEEALRHELRVARGGWMKARHLVVPSPQHQATERPISSSPRPSATGALEGKVADTRAAVEEARRAHAEAEEEVRALAGELLALETKRDGRAAALRSLEGELQGLEAELAAAKEREGRQAAMVELRSSSASQTQRGANPTGLSLLQTSRGEADVAAAGAQISGRVSAHEGPSPPADDSLAAQLAQLAYTAACAELLLAVDLRGAGALRGLLREEEAKECAALFAHLAGQALDFLDPSAVHQAFRGLQIAARDPEPFLCGTSSQPRLFQLLGSAAEPVGEFNRERAYPVLQCGNTIVNMISGVVTHTVIARVEVNDLPAALREQPFVAALSTMVLKSFDYVSGRETLQAVTRKDDQYFLTQRAENTWKARTWMHRRPVSGSETLQLLEPCTWSRFARTVNRASIEVKADLRELLLGSTYGAAFCWVNSEGKYLEVTQVAGGEDDLVVSLTFPTEPSGNVEVTVHRPTPHLPQEAVGGTFSMQLASFWLKAGVWETHNQNAYARADEAMDGAGVFTRFHEGRSPLHLTSSTGASKLGQVVVFPGVQSPRDDLTAIVLKSAATADGSAGVYEYTHRHRTFRVVHVNNYAEDQRYLLEYGVPHILFEAARAYGRRQRSALIALPLLSRSSRGAAKHWHVPLRRAEVFEFAADGAGLFEAKTREERLSLALAMMSVKNFEHAFEYMAGVDHNVPWTESELTILFGMAAVSKEQRDGETSYLRLLAVKLLYEECLRFPVKGCDDRLGLKGKEGQKAAETARQLALQTMHLVPIHQVADMRSLTLTRFFTQGDFSAEPHGLRGRILGADRRLEADLVPRREEVPQRQPPEAARELLYHESEMREVNGQYHFVYPEQVIQDVARVRRHFNNIERLIVRNEAAAQAVLFSWLQPMVPQADGKINPDSSDYAGKQSDYQIALLLHIYRTRSYANDWQVQFLRPFVEAWHFAESLGSGCKDCVVLHGLAQLLLAAEVGEKLQPFEVMIENLRRPRMKPAECCRGDDRMMERVNQEAARVPEGLPSYFRRPYRFFPLRENFIFSGGLDAAAPYLSGCYPAWGDAAEDLMRAMLEAAERGTTPRSSLIHLSFPPPTSRRQRADAVIAAYLSGRHYSVLYPNADPAELHCAVHRYLLARTEEAHESNGLTRNFDVSSVVDFSPRDIRALLVFEYKSGFAIRKAQVEQLRGLLRSDADKAHVQQIMMGGGKTSVYSPVLLNSLDALGGFMAPGAVFSQNTKDLAAKTRAYFGQQGFVLSCERTTGQQKLATLRWVWAQLKEAARLKKYVMMLPRTLQCFQNLLVINLGAPEKYEALAGLLSVLRKEATFVIDEIDTIFDPNTEVNFPLTNEETGKDLPVVQFLSVIFTLPSYPGEDILLTSGRYTELKPKLLDELFDIVKMKQLPFTLEATYPDRIHRIGKDMQACSTDFFIKPLGELAVHRDSRGLHCVHNRDMKILHRFLEEFLPQVIRFRRNVDYGRSRLYREQGYVIPYAFANKPVEGSKFSNYLLSVGLSMQYWFLGGLDSAIFGRLIGELRKQKVRRGKGLLQRVYQYLERDLPELPTIPSELFSSEFKVPRAVLHDKTMIVAFIGKSVLPQITVSSSQVTNFPLNMDSSMRGFIGFSGTISSGEVFPTRAVLTQDSTVEESLRERTVDRPLERQHIFEVDPTAENPVRGLVSGQFRHTNALLDCGAFLRDFKNVDVAKAILKHRKDIKAVLYYHDKKNRIVARGRFMKLTTSSSEKVIDQWRLKYKDIFLYLDQQHTVGTDVRLGASAVAALTVSRKTNLEQLMQAIMRMRNYRGEQTNGELQDVVFVFAEGKPGSLGEVWRRAKANTASQMQGMRPTIHRRKANAIYRRTFLDRDDQSTGHTLTHFVDMVFKRSNDFLQPTDDSNLASFYSSVVKILPRALSYDEWSEVREATSLQNSVPGAQFARTEEELEMELEMEIEMHVERLKNGENLNEDSFTNNPVQWQPMYALCHPTAQASLLRGLHPCAPVGAWLTGGDDWSATRVSATLAFTLVRPAIGVKPGDYRAAEDFGSSLAKQPREDTLRTMQLFQDDWELPYNDEAQAAPLDAVQLLVSDYRKNLRSVAVIASKTDAEDFQILLLTSDEAEAMMNFCSKIDSPIAQVSQLVDPPEWKKFVWDDNLYRRAEEVSKCEDPMRGAYGTKKEISHRFDYWQQVYPYLNTTDIKSDKVNALRSFLDDFWTKHACKVLTPTAIPAGDVYRAVLPSNVQAPRPASEAAAALVKALVEVLALMGSVEALERPEFKPEFFRRMQEPHFRDVYRTVREKMGEPMDSADLAHIREIGEKCEAKCGGSAYEFIAGEPSAEETAVVVCECVSGR